MDNKKRTGWLWWVGGLLLLVAGIILVWWLAIGEPDVEQSRERADDQSVTQPIEATLGNLTPGQTISDAHTLTIDISDPSRVERVEYYIDGRFISVTYALPFSFALNPSKLSEGEHTIGAKVYDIDGNVFDTAEIIFTVRHSSDKQMDNNASAGNGQSNITIGNTVQDTPASNSGGEPSNNGGGNTPTPPDTTPPSAPTNLVLAADDGYTVNLSWIASTDNVAITKYQVFRDGVLLGDASASTTIYHDQTVVPGNNYNYTIKAVDANNNVSSASNEPIITLEPTSIWIDGDSPENIDTDPSAVELGVKFRPLVDGHVSGVRFYKGAGNTGTHVGSLWSSAGDRMADVTFSGETASGWQTASFDTPVAVTAGTTYVVSYSAPNGNISYSSNYFTTVGITSQYLTALASGVDGDNGVYSTTPGTFPTNSFGNNNYWVDATFIPHRNAGGPAPKEQDNSVVYPGFPGSNNTGVQVGKRLPIRDRGIIAGQDGSVIENIEINDAVTVRAADTVIKNSKINDSIVYLDIDAAGSADWFVTIEDSEINAGTLRRGVVTLGQYSIVRSNIYGGQSGVICARNCSVEDSWIHGQYLPDNEDWHLNGFLNNGGDGMTMRGNTISCDHANNGVGGGCSAAISLFADFDDITNVTIDGNLLTANAQQGYCLAAGHSATKPFGTGAANIIVTNNVFQRGSNNLCGAFGPVTDYYIGGNPPPGSTWSGNVWDNGGTVGPN